MNTTPWNCDVPPTYARRAQYREASTSLIASMLFAGFVAFAFLVGEAVREVRAANNIIAATEVLVSKQPVRSGVLSAQMPVF